MSFPSQLTKARKKAGLSIAQAAQQAGVSPRTWAYWEDGERLPPAERDAITRERLIARLTERAAPGNPNQRSKSSNCSSGGRGPVCFRERLRPHAGFNQSAAGGDVTGFGTA